MRSLLRGSTCSPVCACAKVCATGQGTAGDIDGTRRLCVCRTVTGSIWGAGRRSAGVRRAYRQRYVKRFHSILLLPSLPYPSILECTNEVYYTQDLCFIKVVSEKRNQKETSLVMDIKHHSPCLGETFCLAKLSLLARSHDNL